MKEREVFDNALAIVSPEDRTRYLDEACVGNERLRGHIEGLIEAYGELGSFLESPPVGNASPTIDRPISEKPGTVIGPFKLLQQIGEGGMGVVFMAEQTEPLQRTVALKIIKPGMDTRQVIARFEAERQALAMMDHPNIARVIDAGMTETGRPYFVMDLVKGVPITDYCDQQHLSVRQRLELFTQVSHAVQHAHQKGIIHRDLKPSNVLVAEYDGKPIPKVIDFGVAKATEQRLTEQTMFTEYGQLIGTFEYMSPEQARFNQLDVDTRSDIYSLGVLLYELLAGSTPLEKERLRSAAFDEILRLISDEEPPKPSSKLSTSDMLPSIAANRHTEPAGLSREVRGELDWIVMRSLEKDRNRRYQTASALADDVERYLTDQPVHACPPSASYRLKKFVRRNKIAAAFVLILLASVAALTVSYIQTKRNERRATTESARAKAVSDLLREMLGSADAAQAKGADYKVRELLDDFSAGLGDQLAGEPEVEADIRATVGRAYRSVKRPDTAQPHFEKAIELRRRNDGPQSENLAAILVDGAWNLLDQQRHAEAESQANEAVKIYRQRSITGAPLFHALEILQHILISAKRDEDAERVTQQALEVARQSGQEFADQANLLHRYAGLKIRQGDFAKAEQVAYQSVDMHRRLHGEHHPETAFGLTTLANALQPQQKLAEAETAVREALNIFRRQFPDDHPNVRDTNDQLRTVLEASGDKPALEALAKEGAEIAMRSGSPDYRVRLGGLLTNRSIAAARTEDAQRLSMAAAARTEEARRQIRQAIDTYSRVAIEYPNDLDRRVKAIIGFVEIIKVCIATPGFADEVDDLNRRLTAELPKLVAAFSDSSDCQWRSAMIYRSWAFELLPYSTYLPTAEHALSKSTENFEEVSLSDPKRPGVWYYLADTYIILGDSHWRSAKPKDAEAALGRAMEIYDQHAADVAADRSLKEVWFAGNYVCLAYYLACTDREEEAVDFVRKASNIAKRVTDPVDSATTLWQLAAVHLQLGDDTGYRETCKALADVPVDSFDDITKARSIFTCCYAPNALEDTSVPVKRAEEFAANNSVDQRHIVLFALGAALYRDGQYKRAAEQLQDSIDAYPSDLGPGFGVINFQRLFLAMTKWKLGDQDAARRLLAELQPAVDKELQAPLAWNDRATLEVLRREAETLIEQK